MIQLFLLFTVVPALELYLLFQIGALLGPLPTLLLVLLTGAAGAALARREGLGVLRQLARDLDGGIPPASRLVEGGLIVAGAMLLVTPGVLTDLFGLALVFPLTRAAIAPRLLHWLTQRVQVRGLHVDVGESARYRAPSPAPADRIGKPDAGSPFDHPVA